MKQKEFAATLALLVLPISSLQAQHPSSPQRAGTSWRSGGLAVNSGRAKSGERCGSDAYGIACEDDLCCSEWGFCGRGQWYCAASVCQCGYGACDTESDLPKDSSEEFGLSSPLKTTVSKPLSKAQSSNRPVVDEIELRLDDTEPDDLRPIELKTEDELRNVKDGGSSWDEEVVESGSEKETLVSKESRQASGRELFGTLPYGVQITSCRRSEVVALTFDDGPSPYLTGELLDLLDRRGVKATFFVNGDNMGLLTNPMKSQYINRMLDSGHQVGSHGWSHADLDEAAPETRRSEIELLEDAFMSVMGRVPTYFRPPYGSCGAECLALLQEYGYHAIRWDVDTNDWRGDLQESMNTVSSAFTSQDSAVVLAHDIHEITVQSLAAFMIDTAEREGFELVTVGECMNDPRGNWYRDPSTGGRWRGSNVARDDNGSFQRFQHVKDEHTVSRADSMPLSAVSSQSVHGETAAPHLHTASHSSSAKAIKDECAATSKASNPTGSAVLEEDQQGGAVAMVGPWRVVVLCAYLVGTLFLSSS